MTSYNPFSLEGKTIIITGASSGIGKSTAIECSRLGASVIITARNEARLSETLSLLEGSNHKMLIADLTRQEDIERLVLETSSVDGVVLCAGITKTTPFKFSTSEKMLEMFRTNFFGPVELLRLLVKKKKINANGSVVFVSSIGGVQIFEPGNSAYGTSKAAFASMARFCAKEFAPRIRVNSVHPGVIETPMSTADNLSLTQEQLEQYKKKYLMQRFGKPVEVALGIVFLLSDASSYVNGNQLVISGGYK